MVLTGPLLGTRVVLDEKLLEIGRSSQCRLQLESDSISRKHAQIVWNGRHELFDLGSTNGTYVNDIRMPHRVLEDGDRVLIGKVLLKYISADNIESAYQDEVQRLMHYDGLTNLANKTLFQSSLEQALKQREFVTSLVVFDLDYFKRVNDTWGHTAGDYVLRQAAALGARLIQAPRLLARTGGEEFAVLLPNEPLQTGYAVAESLRSHLEREVFSFEGKLIPVTGSFGVATSTPARELTPEQLYEAADQRLYQAKSDGRNCVR